MSLLWPRDGECMKCHESRVFCGVIRRLLTGSCEKNPSCVFNNTPLHDLRNRSRLQHKQILVLRLFEHTDCFDVKSDKIWSDLCAWLSRCVCTCMSVNNRCPDSRKASWYPQTPEFRQTVDWPMTPEPAVLLSLFHYLTGNLYHKTMSP